MSASRNGYTPRIFALCRAGFENDCANELLSRVQLHGLNAYIRAKPGTGHVSCFITDTGIDLSSLLDLMDRIGFDTIIFSRQWFASMQEDITVDENDRVTQLIDHSEELRVKFDSIELSHADTNEGRSLSRFCRQFLPHLERSLRTMSSHENNSSLRLNVFFHDSTHVVVGVNDRENSARHPMGVPRLRMPSDAPSRSTLKLEEAFDTFLTAEEQQVLLRPTLRAVDLGAAPGGWTWQFVRRDMFVTAIDNGDMDERLLRSGMVQHLRVDAFEYMQKKVHWLVCDMVEQPHRVTRLITKWLSNGWCEHTIFNLKLPMKKRYQTVMECADLLIRALERMESEHRMAIKQLYHDREEVTVCIIRLRDDY